MPGVRSLACPSSSTIFKDLLLRNHLPNAFYFVVLVVKMPELAHNWLNKIILFYSILFYSILFYSILFYLVSHSQTSRGVSLEKGVENCMNGPGHIIKTATCHFINLKNLLLQNG